MARVTHVRHGVHDHVVAPHVGSTARAHYPAIVASILASSDYRDAGLAPAASVSPDVLVSREPIAVADGGLALYAAAVEWYEATGVLVRIDGMVRLTTTRQHVIDRSSAERSRASRERARARRALQPTVDAEVPPPTPPTPTVEAVGLLEVIDAWQSTQRPGIFATGVATATLSALVSEYGAERVRRSVMRASEVTTSAYPSLRLVGEITREGPDAKRAPTRRGAPKVERYSDAQWEDAT